MTEIRADMVLVFICRFAEAATADDDTIELLQLQRSRDPARGTWQPVMGTIEPGETAVQAALRELEEETKLTKATLLGMWALDQAPPFYMHTLDAVLVAPRFCALADSSWQPTLNNEHHNHRWIAASEASEHFMWPVQLVSVAEITPELLHGTAPRWPISRVV